MRVRIFFPSELAKASGSSNVDVEMGLGKWKDERRRVWLSWDKKIRIAEGPGGGRSRRVRIGWEEHENTKSMSKMGVNEEQAPINREEIAERKTERKDEASMPFFKHRLW
jgi:hypothetical protein